MRVGIKMRRPAARRTTALLFAVTVLSCVGLPTSPDAGVKGPGSAHRDVTSTRPSVVISQVYGGGGNSGATLKNDFIELFNPGTSAVSVDGWSVQYNSATGTGAWQTTPLTGSIPAGGYYLVQESQGTGGTTPLPTPDASGTIAMAAGAARVVLVSATTALPASSPATCPTAVASVVDLVSYGVTTCGDPTSGTFSIATLTNTTAALRNSNGCAFTGVPQADFTVGTPSPRNTASAAITCPPVQIGTLDHITIGGPASVVVGNTIQLTATGFDAANTQLNPQPTFAWSSDTPANVSVDQTTGVATGVAAGQATITVTSGVVTKTVVITASAPTAGSGAVVISQLYGGGGNSGATFKNDFIELFNRSSQPVDLTGWSVQYNSANGTTAWQVTPLQGKIAANSYVLVQEAAGTAGTVSLPAPDITGSIAMSATDARVALVNSITPLAASSPANCPSTAAGVLDFVAYGVTACGAAAAPELANTIAALRINDGCEFSASPQADFVTGAPNPRNSTTATRSCTLGPINRISVTGTATVGSGATTQLKATAFDASNNVLTHTPFVWGSGDATRATVDQTGLVTGGSIFGPVGITAMNSGVVGSLTVTVVDPNAPAQVTLTSKAALSYPAGYVDVLLSSVTNGNGGAIFPTLTWTTSDANVATVDQQGSVLGVNPGPVTITAAAPNGVSGTQKLTIESHTAPTTAVYRDHLAFGAPLGGDPSDIRLTKTQYVVSYNPNRLGADWVSWNLNGSQFGPVARCNCFSPDPDLPTAVYHVTDFDYTGSGYDRGHMTTSEERTTTDQENATTYILTNVLPQLDANNAGPWEGFENFLNAQAQSGKEIYIMAGPQWGPTVHTLHGEGATLNKVQIPDFTWKVAVILNGGQGIADVHSSRDLQVLAVKMPNLSATDAATGLSGSSAANLSGLDYTPFLTTARSIEQATGLSLLTALSDSVRNIVETNDHAPAAALTGTSSIDEGGTAMFDASGSTDQDPGDAAALRYVWNFGDGSASVTTTSPQQSHAYADNGSYTATVFVYDPAGASGKATHVVTVGNVTPSVTLAATTPTSILSGDAVGVSGSFTDPGADSPWKSVIDWGNGTTTPSTFNTSGPTITGSSTFFSLGTFTVTLSVTDKDNATGAKSLTVNVAARPVPTTIESPSINLNGNGNGDVALTLTNASGVNVSLVDVSSIRVGIVGVNQRGNGFQSDLVGGALTLHFSRRALIDAGVLDASTTELDFTGSLTTGVQIAGRVSVSVH